MFNQLIKPGKFPSFNSETIYLFFCNSSIVHPTRFGHNHYVPLNFCSEKNKANEKRKFVTSQKCKRSKNRTIYFMPHLWKQDLSVKMYLSNFPDHLNLHENPNISKSSTFNLTADNFSSLDNITQNLHRTEQRLFSILPFLILFLSQHLSIYLFPKMLLFLVAKLNIVQQVQMEFKVRHWQEILCYFQTLQANVSYQLFYLCFSNKHSSCNINSNKKSYSSLSQTPQVNLLYLQFLK